MAGTKWPRAPKADRVALVLAALAQLASALAYLIQTLKGW